MKRKVTLTYQPYESMWGYLRLLTSKSNTKKLISGTMKSGRSYFVSNQNLLEKKSTQVSYCIGQADEYFKAADAVTINTSPLLYFYGMLSLTKALIVANHPEITLQDIEYHGLSGKHPDENYNNTNQDLGDEFAVTKGGVFKEFTKIIQKFEFSDNTLITIADILAVDPEVANIYEEIFNKPSKVQYLYSYEEKANPYQLKLHPRTTDKDGFLALFPKLLKDFDIKPEILHEQALILESKNTLKKFPDYINICNPMAGGRYLIGELTCKSKGTNVEVCLRSEISDYILMFILSNCVRYKQDFWGEVLQAEVDGKIGIINLAIANIRFRFPNFILTNLFNQEFSYRSASIFT